MEITENDLTAFYMAGVREGLKAGVETTWSMTDLSDDDREHVLNLVHACIEDGDI